MSKVKGCLRTMAAVAALAFAGGVVNAADVDYGKPGQPVHLVVGFQPYSTMTWSGVVMAGKKFYEKYLPKGSTVDFQIGLQGTLVVNQMLAGKNHIGYLGDTPAIVATTKQEVADVRIVSVLAISYDICNVFISRVDAPKFANSIEAIKWLDGKQIAVPKGSCTDRFAQVVYKKHNIKPAAYLNQNIEVITSNFRAGKLDAAVVWEPVASRLVEEGLARRIASGASVQEDEGGFLAMRADLIKQRPDVVKAWMNAELDAQLYLADEKNAMEVVDMVKKRTSGFSDKVLWTALYGLYPESAGGNKTRAYLHFGFTPQTLNLVDKATVFLHSIKTINTDKLRPDAVMPQFAAEVLKERKLTAPVGDVVGQPDSAFTGKK